jgi:hypothetical protein|tara:strand:- start:311 stop:463 length:153 start_codon:yes stop_codon:yes gene_type:complete
VKGFEVSVERLRTERKAFDERLSIDEEKSRERGSGRADDERETARKKMFF